MHNVLELMQEKNRLLEKFYRLNESEILNFAEGNFERLEDFYDSREGILGMIRRVDGMVEATEGGDDVQEISDDTKKQFLSLINYKNDLVARILSQDLQILSYIEQAKSNLIKELSEVRTARKAVGSYKSGISENQLDEKA